MAAGPSAAKKAKTSALPDCPYGARCYRKNPQHFLEFNHSKGGDGAEKKSKTTKADTSSLPPCQYGAKCYRKNLLHFAEFSHPTTSKTGGDADSGSDTDVYDSDQEDDQKKKKKGGTDILNRGMSLVKSFSQMTEDERRELIKKAFEAKQKLQEELAETKKQVEEKDKELNKLQAQVNTGLLLVDGEKEALEGKKTKYFPLVAERNYKEGSAAQIHFRLAESQFYRLLSGPGYTSYQLSKVEYVVNPELVKKFKAARETLKKNRGEQSSFPVLAFHGTKQENIMPICEAGFKVPGVDGFTHRTDTGWYGKGVYFSEYPAYSMSYIQGATKLLLCQVLPGKVFQCTKLIHGAALKSGYDSHTSPDKKELVIFNNHHILPSYIVHYTTANTDFKYSKTVTASAAGTSVEDDDDDIDEKHKKAVVAKATKIFTGQYFLFSGKFCGTQAAMNKLVTFHGGTAGKISNMTVVVASQDEVDNVSNKVGNAQGKGIPVVREDYIYDCILKKKALAMEDYEYDA